MVDKINQSMLSLAENSKEFKTALRFMLKCEIQLLLDRLSQIGDESLLIIANKSEESTSHFGSSAGESYLQACSSSFNFSIKDTFLKHCLESQGQMMNNSMNPMSGQGQIMNNSMNPMAGQGQMMSNSMNSLSGQGNLSAMLLKAVQMTNMASQAGMTNRQMMGAAANFNVNMRQQFQQTNRFNPYQQQASKTMGMSSSLKTPGTKTAGGQDHKDIHANRAICRHFAKGNCWQGNMCAFLHLHQEPDSSQEQDSKHDPNSLTTVQANDQKDSSSDDVIK